MSKYNAPGRSNRTGTSVIELFDMFPDEDSARQWFESICWPEERYCGHCGSTNTREAKNHKSMPYWCSNCRSFFSVKTGTVMQSSRLPLRKWIIATYLMCTNLKGVSSMKLHRDLGITQKSAWYLGKRIRESWARESNLLACVVEVDEICIGGKESNEHKSKKLNASRRNAGKTTVI